MSRLSIKAAPIAALLAAAVSFPTTDALGFSLMGQFGDWAAPTNSYRMGWDVGGPVDITEGYRWNVPVVTYGFDQSFLTYFGTNGVSAVEQAIGFSTICRRRRP